MSEPIRFRKRSAEIYAIRFDGTNHEAIHAFAPGCFEEVDPEDRGDDPDVVATVWNQHYGVRLPVKVGRWIARDQHGFFTIRAERMDKYEAIDQPEAFTWGEGLAIENGHVTIPVNRGDTHIGDLKLAVRDSRLLSDMLADALDQDALEQHAGLERCRD